MTYTKVGPFTNNSAPGIDANFLNGVETALAGLNSAASDSHISANGNGLLTVLGIANNPTPVTVNGTVSGNTTIYQYMQGTVKKALVIWTNYKSAAAQSIALPVRFTSYSYWIVTELQGGNIAALSSGSAQTFSVLTTTGLTGVENPQAYMASWSQGMCRAGFDTLKITVTGATPAGGMAIIEGV